MKSFAGRWPAVFIRLFHKAFPSARHKHEVFGSVPCVRTRMYFTVVLAITIMASACVPPDRWAPFDKDPHPSDPPGPIPRVTIPEDLEPQPAETMDFHWPVEGEAVDMSLEQATMLALQNNTDLRVQLLGPVIAGTFEEIERGVYDPELFAEMVYERERTVETSRSTEDQFPVEGEDLGAGLGVRQRIPTGTEIEATASLDYDSSSRTPEQYTSRLGIGLTQSLLQGLGPSVNLASVRQAEMEFTASIYELRGFTEALLADTEIAYWNHVLAGEKIAIFESSLAIARQQREETELRIEVGLLPRNEAAAARAEVALNEQALIDARSVKEAERLRLLRLISPDPAGRLDAQVRTTSPSRIEPRSITDLADRIRLAERSRPDLNEARLRMEQNRLETVVTRNGLLPRLDLFIMLGKTGFGDSFSDAFREIDSDTYDLEAGVRFSHLLGNRGAKASDLAARASTRQAAKAVANLREIVRFDVRLAANEVERTRQQITATAATRALQEQVLTSEQERFNVGASTSLLVAGAQRDLLAIRIAEVEAIINYRIALIELYLAEGSLLERRGVRIAATPP
jgi:outer membrane protein TolC